MEEQRAEKVEEKKESTDLKELIQEVVERYGEMPLMPIEDVEMGARRVFHVREADASAKDGVSVKRYRAKNNCRKCYGMGYVGLFESNEEQYGGLPLLQLCSCLREVKHE